MGNVFQIYQTYITLKIQLLLSFDRTPNCPRGLPKKPIPIPHILVTYPESVCYIIVNTFNHKNYLRYNS